MPKLYKFYDVLPDPTIEDGWCVQLKNCDFAGIKYRYGKFKIVEKENENGHAQCVFDYNVIDVPEELAAKVFPDERQQELNNLMGDIVIEILEDYFIDKDRSEIITKDMVKV